MTGNEEGYRVLAIAAIVLGASLVPGSMAAQSLAITPVTVIDVREGVARPDRAVVVEGDRITSVGPADSVEIPAASRVVDGTGKFLVPGLMDVHVHLGLGARETQLRALRLQLAGGITTIRDPAGDARITGYLSRQALAGEIDSPDIFYAALMGGPGFAEFAPVAEVSLGWEPGTAPWAREVGSSTDVGRVIAEARGTGATGIKMYRYLSPELASALASEARKQGMRVWSHARIRGHNQTGEPSSRPSEVVDAGAEVLSHANHFACEVKSCASGEERSHAVATVDPAHPAIRAVLTRMAAQGAILDPTLSNLSEFESEPHWMRFAAAVTGLAHEMGVAVVTGTDVPLYAQVGPLPHLHKELVLLVEEAGFTPTEALAAATLTAARTIGQESKRGTIEQGKLADLVLLDANPLEDIRHTREIAAVVLDGRYLDRAALDRLLADAGQAANPPDAARDSVRPEDRPPAGELRSDTVHVAPPTGEKETDRASILAALEEVEPGGTVQFAPGTYLVGEIIPVPQSGITLQAHPNGTTLRGCKLGGPPASFSSCGVMVLTGGWVTLRGFTIEQTQLGVCISACGYDLQAPVGDTVGGYRIEDNTFRNSLNAIRGQVVSSDTTVIRNNRFINTFHAVGIQAASHLHVVDNRVSAPDPKQVPGIGHLSFAIAVAGGPNLVARNYIEGHPEGIVVTAFPGETASGNVIRENTIVVARNRLPDGGSPALTNSDPADSTIVGVPLLLNAWITLGDSTETGRVSNNLVEGNRILGAEGIGIELGRGSSNRIVGNEVAGIVPRSPFPGNSVSTNPEPWRDANGSGIWVAPGSDGNELIGNTFEDIAAAAVVVEGNGNRVVLASPEDEVRDLGKGNQVSESTSGGWSHSSDHQIRLVPVASEVELEVLDWGGDGEALVFLPGMSFNAHTFDDFAPRFTDRYRVVGITRRGHGASSWPDSGYSLEARVNDLRIVLDSLGIERVIFAGHSLAGSEMTRFAARHPDRVVGLIYIDAAHDLAKVLHVFEACPPIGTDELEAFENQLENPELHRRTQLRSDTGFVYRVSPGAIEQIAASFTPPNYAPVQAPALAVYVVPEHAEDARPGEDLSPACATAFQRYLYGSIAEFVEDTERATVVALQDTQHNIHLVTPDRLEEAMRRWLADLHSE